jgi:hypothetical protein
MISGFLSVAVLWLLGFLGIGKAGKMGAAAQDFAPVYLFGLDPLLYGLASSFLLAIVISLCTQPLPRSHVDRYFLAGDRSP